jgi:hypothetical protein
MAVPPPAGASSNWDPNTPRVAEEIERNFDVRCSTYPGHGRTGQPWGIDAWVASFRSRANRVREQLSDRIQHYVERNRLGIDYMIWSCVGGRSSGVRACS